jgi:hypothetical protein
LSSLVNRIENNWFGIIKNGTKYTVAGIYCHPNQNIDVFKANLYDVLSDFAKQQCFIAGDVNIDLTICY